MYVTVVTGASMGIGEEFARQLAARKQNLVLVARSEDRLMALSEELKKRNGVRALPLVCDLSQSGAAAKVEGFLSEKGIHPVGLVNNAGFGGAGDFDSMELEKVHNMMMVNMVSLVELTHQLLPALRLGRNSRIINVASTAAFQPVPYMSLYAATKAFVLSFTEALHEELRKTDVRVTALCPGPTPTNFHVPADMNAEVFERGQSAQEVVRMGLEASDRNAAVKVTQRAALVVTQRFFPRAMIRWGAGMVAKRMLPRAMKKDE